MSIIIFLFSITIASALACHHIAKNRGAKPAFWLVMALVFGPLAIPFVLFAKPKNTEH